jgi:hypothetical protein
MPVGVHRLGDRRVTQPGLDRLRVQPGRDERRCVEAPQVVNRVPFGSPASLTASRQQWPKLLRCTGLPSRLVMSSSSGPGLHRRMCSVTAVSTMSSTGTTRVLALVVSGDGDRFSPSRTRISPTAMPSRRWPPDASSDPKPG